MVSVVVVPAVDVDVNPVRLVKPALADEALVPPFAIGNTPVTPVVKGRPVPFVSVTEVGVPKTGVTSVGLVENTKFVDVVPVAPAAV